MSSYASRVDTGSGTPSPIGSNLYGICNTAANEAAKAVTLDNFDTLLTGVTVHVKFTYGNTAASPTLAVGSTAAAPIYKYGTTVPGTTVAASWAANSMVSFTYDGTAWRMNDVGAEDAIIEKAENDIRTADAALKAKIAPNYSATSTYGRGDLVWYDGGLYRCTTTIETAEAWTSTHWTATTITTELVDKDLRPLVLAYVSTGNFTNSNGITNFPYRAEIADNRITSDMSPYVIFGGNDAGSGKYAPYAQSDTGKVYVYATGNYPTNVTIVFWRAY